MANIKDLFNKAENGTLTYEQFQAAATAAGAKFTDLSEGQYVSKKKHEDELGAKSKEIETLNQTISTRDTDLAALQKKLAEAGTDAEKLNQLSGEFTTLQNKYDTDVKAYQDQLKHQAYEFAVKEFAATKKFTSQAARRDFTHAMLDKELKMDNGKILGAEDFVAAYSADNADAFVQENQDDKSDSNQNNAPQFVDSTPGGNPPQDSTGGFAGAFHFTGVRPIPKN